MTEEIWRDVGGYEGLYQVSNLGRVRSLDRFVENTGVIGNNKVIRLKGKVLKKRYSNLNTKGVVPYGRVLLLRGGKAKQFCVHKLVAQAFIPNPENKPQVDHIDGNSFNDAVTNLRWCTQQENNNNFIWRQRQATHFYEGDTARRVAETNGINNAAFSSRLHNRWSIEDAVKIKLGSCKRYCKRGYNG